VLTKWTKGLILGHSHAAQAGPRKIARELQRSIFQLVTSPITIKMESMRNLLEDQDVEMSYHTSGMELPVSIEELKLSRHDAVDEGEVLLEFCEGGNDL
jgi:hypothetical protein